MVYQIVAPRGDDAKLTSLIALVEAHPKHMTILETAAPLVSDVTGSPDGRLFLLVIFGSGFRAHVCPDSSPALGFNEVETLRSLLNHFVGSQPHQLQHQLMVFAVRPVYCGSCVALLHDALKESTSRSAANTISGYKVCRFGNGRDYLVVAYPTHRGVSPFWVHQQVVHVVHDVCKKGIALVRIAASQPGRSASAGHDGTQLCVEHVVAVAFRDGRLRATVVTVDEVSQTPTQQPDLYEVRSAVVQRSAPVLALRDLEWVLEVSSSAVSAVRTTLTALGLTIVATTTSPYDVAQRMHVVVSPSADHEAAVNAIRASLDGAVRQVCFTSDDVPELVCAPLRYVSAVSSPNPRGNPSSLRDNPNDDHNDSDASGEVRRGSFRCINDQCVCVNCVCVECLCGRELPLPSTAHGQNVLPGADDVPKVPTLPSLAEGKASPVTLGTASVYLASELVTFVVEGMSCASCAARIERELRRTPGVYLATVNFAAFTAAATIDPTTTTPDVVCSKINDMGYRAQISHGVSGFDQARKALQREDEIKWLRIKTLVFAIFSLPLLALMFVLWLMPSAHKRMQQSVFNMMTVNMLVQILLASPIVLVGGKEYFHRAVVALRHRSFTMDTLITFGVGGAYVFSLIGFVLALADYAMLETYFDAAGVILFFMIFGKFLEARAKRGTSRALMLLMGLVGDKAVLVTPTGEVEVPCSLLGKDDIVRVSPGGHIPVDGIVESGSGAVDEQLITGESLPKEKSPGDPVIGGTLCLTSDLLIRATRVGEETTLFRITKIVQEAQNTKPEIQRVADRIAGVFVPIIITYSVLVFLVWIVLGYTDSYPEEWRDGNSPLTFAFTFFLATVVVACPCALGLATPTAIMVGTGMGATHGILVKSGPTLEKAREVTCVLFDKTGTLTEGKLAVADYWTPPSHPGTPEVSDATELDDVTLRAIVGTVESRSKHPIGTAISTAFGVVQPDQYSDLFVETLPGHGLRATLTVALQETGKHTCSLSVVVGSPAHVVRSGVAVDEVAQAYVSTWQSKGCTVVLAAVNGTLRLAISVSDTPKRESRAIVKELKRRGIRSLMVTGDNRLAARHVASCIGIDADCIFAEVLPEDKQACVKKCQDDGDVVCFVGDGLNDSPALTQANVGVAIGAGTEVAIEAADAVLMRSNLHDLLTFLDLSSSTVRRIYFNFAWAVVYNFASLPFASGIFYPAIKWVLPPTLAGGSMVLSSLSVLVSSLALKCFSPTKLRDVDDDEAKEPFQ